MTDKKRVKGVVIEINGKEQVLELDEAMQLYEGLAEFFGNQTTTGPSNPVWPMNPLSPNPYPTCTDKSWVTDTEVGDEPWKFTMKESTDNA